MSDITPLPKFKNPPVDEVAVGIQFSAANFRPTHYGSFYEKVRAKFPHVQTMPPFVPNFEQLGAPPAGSYPAPVGAQPAAVMPLPWPRVLFVADDDCSLIQLQNDRLFFNWRRRPHKPDYPNYDSIEDGFAEAFLAFRSLALDQGFGPIIPTQCEIFYANPLPYSVTGEMVSEPAKVFRVLDFGNEAEVGAPLEDISFTFRYKLSLDGITPSGRLIATCGTVRDPDGQVQLRLDMTARGVPAGDDADGVFAFHRLGHEAIVRCFAAITTPAMHAKWDRYQ